MKRLLLLFGCVLASAFTQAAPETAAVLEPGPENGGLRLRFAVAPRAEAGKECYDVRIELLNVSKNAITVRAAWQHEADTGNLVDYLEAATSIACVPAVRRWTGGVQ